MKFRVCSLVVGGSVLVVLGVWGDLSVGRRAPQSTETRVARAKTVQLRALENYGKLPLSFEVNRGQTDAQVKFLARGQGYTLFLTSQEAVLALHKSEGKRLPKEGAEGTEGATWSWELRPASTTLQMKLLGANPKARVKGTAELPGKSNYFIGNDPKKWRTNIPTYASVRLEDVYPGTDLVYYGNQGRLEYDFVVQPGADPSAIRLSLVSAHSVARIEVEDLVVQADGGEVRFHKPVIYQPASTDKGQGTTEKTLIAGGYTIDGQKEVAFAISDYDRTKPLVIDPVLVYSTYLGGSGGDAAHGVALDAAGNAYVTGSTNSTDFPTTANTLQAGNHGSGDAFVTKFNADGSTLLYFTYLGGSGVDTANGIAVDSAGDAYVTGTTRSTDFPTVNPFQATGHWNTFFGGSSTSFVTKLNTTGSGLVYSTYLGSGTFGGEVGDNARGIVVGGSGNAYVTGFTDSSDFPTANAIQPTNHSRGFPASNGFVTEFNASGSTLVYSTYLGGSGNASNSDRSNAIAVDDAGNAYVTGFTASRDFPTTPNSLQPTCSPGPAGCNLAFVTEISAGGAALAYSTYLDQAAQGNGIAVDGSGSAYTTGFANSGGAFVAKLNPGGSSLLYFTDLTANASTFGTGIALNGAGSAFITGSTYANNFPTANPIQATNNAYASGGDNAFVVQLAPDGSGPVYSTYLGGSSRTEGDGIAVDSSGNAYVTGFTGASDFPTTTNAFQTSNRDFNGFFYGVTAFVTKISPPETNIAVSNTASGSVSSGSVLTYTIVVTNNGPDAASSVEITDAVPPGSTFDSVVVSAGSCHTPRPGGRGAVACTAPTLASGSSITETLNVNVTAASGRTIRDTATATSTTLDPNRANNSATAITRVI